MCIIIVVAIISWPYFLLSSWQCFIFLSNDAAACAEGSE